MSKISKVKVVFIVLLTLVVLVGLFMTLLDMISKTQEPKVSGFGVHFENETTDAEIKTILENCNMTVNYTIDYNSTTMRKNYYVKVDKGRSTDILNKLNNYKNLTSEVEVKKTNYSVIVLSDIFIPDEKFIAMLDKDNLQVKKSVFCYIRLGDGSGNYTMETNYILNKDAIRIKNELETSVKVLFVTPDYLKGR